MEKHKILMIDDDLFFLKKYQALLSDEHEVFTSSDLSEGILKIQETEPSILLLDISMKTEREGIEVIPYLKKEYPKLPIVVVTNWDSHLVFKEAIEVGADDFFIKSDNLSYLRTIILNQISSLDNALNSKQFCSENKIIAVSREMQAVLKEALQVARARCSVLLTGETGVGKEVVAQFIHKNSHRKNGPFVAVNCAAIPDSLVESELFGFEKGAFTGAHRSKIGRFEAANGGTIFLDEIEELPLKAQAALLRVTQEQEVEHLGGTQSVSVDVRVISACQHSLQEKVKRKQFRDDLYFRLAVYTIQIPPLRDREADILPLANFFMTEICRKNNIREKSFSRAAQMVLKNYSWPGNVRQLRNVIERAIIKSGNQEIDVGDLALDPLEEINNPPYEIARNHTINEFKKNYIKAALVRNKGNITATAKHIGLSRQALQKIIKEFKLNVDDNNPVGK